MIIFLASIIVLLLWRRRLKHKKGIYNVSYRLRSITVETFKFEGPIFVGKQIFAGSWGHYFVGKQIIIYWVFIVGKQRMSVGNSY